MIGTIIHNWKVLDRINKQGIGWFYTLQCSCGRIVEKAEKTVYKSESFPKKCIGCFKKEYKEKYAR